MRPAIRPGGIFPDYALPDDHGTMRTLSGLQGRDPLIPDPGARQLLPKEQQTAGRRSPLAAVTPPVRGLTIDLEEEQSVSS